MTYFQHPQILVYTKVKFASLIKKVHGQAKHVPPSFFKTIFTLIARGRDNHRRHDSTLYLTYKIQVNNKQRRTSKNPRVLHVGRPALRSLEHLGDGPCVHPWVSIGSFHGKRLAGPRLAVGEDAHIVPSKKEKEKKVY